MPATRLFYFETSALDSTFWIKTMGLSVVWAAFAAMAVLLPISQLGHRQSGDLVLIGLFCVIGAALGMILSRSLVTVLLRHRSKLTIAATMFSLLVTLTIGFILLLVALHFRSYFAQWHEPFPSPFWFAQFIFTTAYAGYLFASTTLHELAAPSNVGIAIFMSWIARPTIKTQ